MKKVLLSIIALAFVAQMAAQSNNILRGIISLKGEERKPLKGVSVQAVGISEPVLTDDNGFYEIKCKGMSAGDDVTLVVKKEGYVPIHKEALQAVTIKKLPTQLFHIVMQEEGKQKSDISKAEKNIKDNANQNFQKIQAELLAMREQMSQYAQQPGLNDIERKGYLDSISHINTRLYQATQERDAAIALAAKTAEQLLAFDTEGASKESKRALAFVEQGKLDSAYASMNEETIRRKANAAKQLQAKSDSLRQSAIVDYFYKGQLAVANGKFADAERLYREGINLDSTDVYNIWTLASFLAEQNKKHEAIHYYEKALRLTKTSESKAHFQNNLGILYRSNQKMPQAEAAYNAALKIFRQLAEKKPDAFLQDVAMTLNNLGVFYRANQKMLQAEGAYNEALKIYRQLAGKNPDAFLPDLAMTLNNLGDYYGINNKMPQAEAAYKEALLIQRQLADKNPDTFLPDVAMTLNNLGLYYQANQKMPQSEAAYNEALLIYKQLADKNPDAFLPNFATTLNNLGLYYQANQKMPQSEAAYNEALSICRQLADKNPDAFLPNFATTLNNLGLYYRANQKIPQAEATYNEALSIFRQLTDKNPDAFLPNFATTLNNLGVFYQDNQKMPQAEGAYNEALKIRRQLAEKNPDAFLPDLAMTLNNLGIYYSANQKMPQAEGAYNEALKIRRQLAEKNPDAFLPDLAMTLNNLIFLNIEKPKEAEKHLKESLLITRKLAEASPDAQNLELARTLILGGFVYESLGNTEQSQSYFKEALSIAEQYPEVPFAQQLMEMAKGKIKE
jgi:tetratricopeptide (TPR) repeat protein